MHSKVVDKHLRYPSFSVLMCVYVNDKTEHLLEAVNSILDQTIKPEQIVIVRDGPVTELLQKALDDLVTKDANLFTLINLNTNSGLSVALNVGLRACRNEYVARHDADDISLPNRFQKQLDVFMQNPHFSLISGWNLQFDSSMSERVGLRVVPEFHEDIAMFAKRRTPFNHACSFFRLSCVKEVGGYPDIKGLLEDWWLALRLINAGKILYNLQESLVCWRGGDKFYERRWGVRYVKQEWLNLLAMYNTGLLPLKWFIFNVATRCVPRLVLPTSIVEIMYRSFLRTKDFSNSLIYDNNS